MSSIIYDVQSPETSPVLSYIPFKDARSTSPPHEYFVAFPEIIQAAIQSYNQLEREDRVRFDQAYNIDRMSPETMEEIFREHVYANNRLSTTFELIINNLISNKNLNDDDQYSHEIHETEMGFDKRPVKYVI